MDAEKIRAAVERDVHRTLHHERSWYVLVDGKELDFRVALDGTATATVPSEDDDGQTIRLRIRVELA
jgi:hypothetical protein